MSPTPMHQPSASSPVFTPRTVSDMRQEQTALEKRSYLSSQWEMCSTGMERSSCSMAFSTGMTCMPSPPPPGGTMGATCAGPVNAMRSK